MNDDAQTEITQTGELLYRQVHPSFIQNERISSQAFRPNEDDERKLSVSRESLTTAKDAFTLYTEAKKLRSIGVWAVSVSESNQHDLKCFSDPLETPISDPAHSLIDFSKAPSEQKVRQKGEKLANLARVRGRLHPQGIDPKQSGSGS